MSQKRRLQNNLCFQIFMLRLFVTLVLRFAAHTWSRFGHPWNVLLNNCSCDLISPLNSDLFILVLTLYAFSALASAFQHFTRKLCLQISGLKMRNFT